MKKLIIDNLIFQWQKSGGISVVWFEIISRLLKAELPVQFIEYDRSHLNRLHQLLDIPQTRVLRTISSRFMTLRKYLPVAISSEEPFIYHASYYRWCSSKNAINVVTVHDFTYEYFCHGLRRWVHHVSKSMAIKKARRVICVSENSKRDLLRFFPDTDPDKISVIYNGVADCFKPLDQSLRYDRHDRFLLFVGSREKYKNFHLAVEAARMTGIKLIIVGRKLSRDERKRVENLLGYNYADLGFVTNEELNTLYNKALVLVYPSVYEGFGLPVVEAQKAGCPVIARKGSSITEICGNDTLLITEDNAARIVEIINALEDEEYREKVIQEGLLNAERFSWDKTFEAYLALYRQL